MNWWRQHGWMILYPVLALIFTAAVFVAAFFILLIASAVTVDRGTSATRPPGTIWFRNERPYRCAGSPTAVICHSRPQRDGSAYRMSIIGGQLWVGYRGKLIYQCFLRRAPKQCRRIP